MANYEEKKKEAGEKEGDLVGDENDASFHSTRGLPAHFHLFSRSVCARASARAFLVIMTNKFNLLHRIFMNGTSPVAAKSKTTW